MAALLAYAQERFPVRKPWETCCRNTAGQMKTPLIARAFRALMLLAA